MIVPGLVEIRFPSLRCQPESVLELLSCETSLQNAVELLRVYVERGLFGMSPRNEFR